MMVAAIAPTKGSTDARAAARHADAALRRASSTTSAGDGAAARDGRRFELVLVRRIASA
jgi:hypothetical protein